ncbi:MAG: phospho-N-acetylmuramoyl-pentapeptide-transferase [bacterium]
MMHAIYQYFYEPETWLSFVRLFQYITFRTAYAAVTSLIMCWGLVWWLTPRFRSWNLAQRDLRPFLEFQEGKEGTPTMGGLLLVFSVIMSTVIWADLSNRFIQMILFVMVTLGLLGALDDWYKMRTPETDGLSVKTKLLVQLIVGVVVGLWLIREPLPIRLLWLSEEFRYELSQSLFLPFMKEVWLPLGLLYIPLVIIVVIGTSNAVNLTDGLDGLAIGSVTFCAVAYGAMAYISGHYMFSEYLQVPNIRGSGELTVFVAALIGAALGFLWFNAHPAQIFMGDAGSLPLGGSIGILAVIIKQELLLVVVGGIFVIEALSVFAQIGCYKLTGRRLLKMAPLHHHFELKGVEESKITIRFWIVGIILALIALSTLKLR